jgi:hypothetical protein
MSENTTAATNIRRRIVAHLVAFLAFESHPQSGLLLQAMETRQVRTEFTRYDLAECREQLITANRTSFRNSSIAETGSG